MIGLPGESYDEGLDTVEFLIANRKYISAVSFNVYYLTPANRIFDDPHAWGVRCRKSRKLPFRFFYPFVNERGMSTREASLLQELYETLLSKARTRDKDKKALPSSFRHPRRMPGASIA